MSDGIVDKNRFLVWESLKHGRVGIRCGCVAQASDGFVVCPPPDGSSMPTSQA